MNIKLTIILVSFLLAFNLSGCGSEEAEQVDTTVTGTTSTSTSSSVTTQQSSSVSSSADSQQEISDSEEQQEVNNTVTDDSEQTSADITTSSLPSGSLTDWNLILLNHSAENKIDSDIDFTKSQFDTQYIDSRIADNYQQMYDDAKKAGITLYLRSGYRSIATQSINYNANIDRLKYQGHTEAEAIRQTNLYYTVPGHSEHHTGLALDIITPEYHNNIYTLNDQFADTDAYVWLLENCANYGFILRYPQDKTDITEINFEPWHYRYVGYEHAQYIMNNDICMEEYVELLKSDGR